MGCSLYQGWTPGDILAAIVADVPPSLAARRRDLPRGFARAVHRMLAKDPAERFADYVQIDLMDGLFVPTRCFAPETLNSVQTTLAFEVHLMVRDPLKAVAGITHRQLRSVIFHVESEGDHEEVIAAIRTGGRPAGLAFKPGTDLDEAERLLGYVDTLLFLTVDPCCYGNPFRPEVLEKVRRARAAFPDKTTLWTEESHWTM